MLSEQSREAFLDIVRPPDNYQLKYCLGTTFSMELPCLIQLALNTQGGKEEINDLSVHEGFDLISTFAQKSIVFTQNCRIKSLSTDLENTGNVKKGRFFALLDGIVAEIPTIAEMSAFHPKVWFIRYDHENNAENSLFKLLVMSRNLTSSLKWEVASCFVGQLNDNPDDNSELAHFFSASLKASSSKNDLNKKRLIKQACRDLSKIAFDRPEKRVVKSWSFLYKWGREKPWIFFDINNYKKVIVVSPFLSGGTLKLLDKKGCYLITSSKDLYKVAEYETLAKNTFVMNPEGMDLHAKIYLGLNEHGTDVYLGSANFTGAAWYQENMEAMVYFHCAKSVFSNFESEFIIQNPSKDGQVIYHDWLSTFDDAYSAGDIDQALEGSENIDLSSIQQKLSCGEFELIVDNGSCSFSYQGDYQLPDNVKGTVSIIGISTKASLDDVLSDGVQFEDIKLSDISAFVVVDLICEQESLSFCTVAISNIDRRQRNKSILNHVIKDVDAFWDYFGVVLNISKSFSKDRAVSKPINGTSNITHGGKPYKVGLGYLETLLMSSLKYEGVIDNIESALECLKNNSSTELDDELINFLGFWEQYKVAVKEVYPNDN